MYQCIYPFSTAVSLILKAIGKQLDKSETRTTRVRHECDTNDLIATQVKKIDFENTASENIFSNPYISYKANERLQREEQFHLRTTF